MNNLICCCGSQLDGSHDHTTCGPPVIYESEIEKKLIAYLDDLKKRRTELEQKNKFCVEHKLFEEHRWIQKQSDILCAEYVEIYNKVLGVYF